MQLRLAALIFIAASLIQCGGVDNSVGTYGSLDCNPTQNDLDSFYSKVIVGTQGLEAQTTAGNTCLGCHGNSPGTDYSRLSRFRLNTVSATDPAVQKQNFCVVYMWGQRSPDQAIITHPQGTTHDGGQVTAAQISDLITWVNTYVLPSDKTPPVY